MDIAVYLQYIVPIISCIIPVIINHYLDAVPDRNLKHIEKLIDLYNNVPLGDGIQNYELEILLRLRLKIYEEICSDLNIEIETSNDGIYIQEVPQKRIWEKFSFIFLFSSGVPIIFYFLLAFAFQYELSILLIIQVIAMGLAGSLIGSIFVSRKYAQIKNYSSEKGKKRAESLQMIMENLREIYKQEEGIEKYLGRRGNNHESSTSAKKSDSK